MPTTSHTDTPKGPAVNATTRRLTAVAGVVALCAAAAPAMAGTASPLSAAHTGAVVKVPAPAPSTATAVTSTAAMRAVVYACGGDAKMRPARYTLACADANEGVRNLRWKGWGTPKATAKGTMWTNDCTPDCAAGKMKSVPVTVTVDNLVKGEATGQYRRMTVTVTGTPPKGVKRVSRYRISPEAGPVLR